MAQTQEHYEMMMYTEIAATCAQNQSMEKEWDSDKFAKKMSEYLRKAAKDSGGPGDTWQQAVESVSNKFFELIAAACYDRAWLEHADFALPLSLAVKAYCINPGLFIEITAEDYLAHVSQCFTLAHDYARYSASAWEPLKQIVTHKLKQKKVRKAVDGARELVVSQMPPNVDVFITTWIQESITQLIPLCFRTNPKAELPEADAIQLFDEMIQRGCALPRWLESLNGGKPPPGYHVIATTVQRAYAGHEEMRSRPPGQAAPAGKGAAPGAGAMFGGYGGGDYGNLDPQLVALLQYQQAYGQALPALTAIPGFKPY